ncbi:MAG: cytochrome c oxidase subunit 3 [Sphingobacteriales bacterium]|nr:cytochrome c oxidase subunit 3 [Sphingobacteriales bacterium]
MSYPHQITEYNSRIHPKRFTLLVSIASMIMMFAGLTSAYIVRKAQGNWVTYKIPPVFWISTLIIIASSIAIHVAYTYFKKESYGTYRYWLVGTFLLGMGFLLCQYLGWQELVSYGIRLRGNPSGSFFYVISGAHALHLLGGLVLLLIFIFRAFWWGPVEQLIVHDNPERTLGIELLMTYWHFVDILWLYLFGFLWLNAA